MTMTGCGHLEIQHGLDPLNPFDAMQDKDGDGYSNSASTLPAPIRETGKPSSHDVLGGTHYGERCDA